MVMVQARRNMREEARTDFAGFWFRSSISMLFVSSECASGWVDRVCVCVCVCVYERVCVCDKRREAAMYWE